MTDSTIFRAYDIRGIYGKTLDTDTMKKIGMALGTMMKRKDMGKEVLVGNDIRASSPELSKAFIEGVVSTGVNVTDVGTTSFGVALFSGWKSRKDVTAFITASHNPPEWNGIKFFDKDCIGFFEKDNQELGRIVLENDFDLSSKGSVSKANLLEEYKNHLKKKFNFKKRLKVVVDCGNASTAIVAPAVFNSFDTIDADFIFENVDPLFSGRGADVEESNLKKLSEIVKEKGADMGIAFDGDGDRMGVIDEKGKFVKPEQVMAILAKGMIGDKKNVVVNVETSMIIEKLLEPLGGKVLRIPVGHTFLTQNVRNHDAVLGGEPSSHYVIPSYFPFDDAIVPALKLMELLSQRNEKLSDIAAAIPLYPKDKATVNCDDRIKFRVMNSLKDRLSKSFDKVNTMDGIRADLENGWALIRPSNTSPLIRVTVEAVNNEELERLKSQFISEVNDEIERVKAIGNVE